MDQRLNMRVALLTVVTSVLAVTVLLAQEAAQVPATPTGEPPVEVAPDALIRTLSAETGGQWESGRSVVYTSPKKGCAFYIHYAPCQQDQGLLLNHYVSWMRPMAIIWAGNGWTVVSDNHAWRSNRDTVLKLVAILERSKPDDETWKTARRIANEANKPDAGDGK